MFSGIVEELGHVVGDDVSHSGRLVIAASAVLADVKVGDSIAVNGCCLTVAALTDEGFAADVMPETVHRTNFERFVTGTPVNLEASLRLGERVGGHLVTGHVDGIGEVIELRDDGNAVWVTCSAPGAVMPLLVEKGCVAVDGISLTVVDVLDAAFTVSMIPHTLAATTAGNWTVGSLVNLEGDLVAKYVARSLASGKAKVGL